MIRGDVVRWVEAYRRRGRKPAVSKLDGCDCGGERWRCFLHRNGKCPYSGNGERYKRGAAIVGLCSACALMQPEIYVDRSWGAGHGAIDAWVRQGGTFEEAYEAVQWLRVPEFV